MREQEEILKSMSAVAGVGYGFQTTITPQNSGDSGEGGDPPPPGDGSGEGGDPPPPGDGSGEGGDPPPPGNP